MAGTLLGMAVFFVLYFWTLRHPRTAPVVVPVTALDRWIGFFPLALPFYLSLWAYVSLAPALLVNPGQLRRHGVGTVVLAATGRALFLLWPTTMAPSSVDWSEYPAFLFMKTVDASGNACPSLHAAFAVYTALWFARIFRDDQAAAPLRWLNWIWCLGILYSTMATRQHVFVDVLAGGVLGTLVGRASVAR